MKAKIEFWILAFSLVLVSTVRALPQSTSEGIYRDPRARAFGASAAPAAPPVSGTIRLRPYVVMDPLMGIEASRFLAPSDWQAEGGVVWRRVPWRPAAVSMRVFNPHGVEEIGVFPDVPCVWAQRPMYGFPEGSNYLGNEVRRPISDPIQAIRMMIVPRYRPHLRNATIVKQELLPEMAKAWAAAYYSDLASTAFKGGKIRFEYQQSGKIVEEEIYAVVGQFTVSILGIPTTFWGLDAIRYSKAEKGKIEQQYKLFQTIFYSAEPNLRWWNRYSQVRDQMVQNAMNASNAAVEASHCISRTTSHVSDIIRQSYERRQAAMARVNANWDKYIRGVDEYRNPWGGSSAVQLPSGHNRAWANSRGEYILSDNANFNPNIGTNQEWRLMERQH